MKSELRSICIIVPSLVAGGAERVVVSLANEFVRRGYQTALVSLLSGSQLKYLIDRRVELVEINASRFRFGFLQLVMFLKRSRFDVLVANMWPITILVLFAKWLSASTARVTFVEHATWSQSASLDGRLKRLLFKISVSLLYPFSSAVVCVSKGAASDLQNFCSLPTELIRVIYNPVSIDIPTPSEFAVIREMRVVEKWLASSVPVIAVGSLKKEKDFSTLLRAVAISTTQMDIKLMIVGEGPERPILEALIKDLGLDSRVFLVGYVEKPSLFVGLAAVHILCSYTEAFPLVLVEALGLGIPVISTDCPSGPTEILEGGAYGLLVPVGDAQTLAQALIAQRFRAFDPDSLRCRAREFSVTLAATRYLEVFGQSIGEKSWV